MSIKLKDIWPIENVGDYKVHFGRYNGNKELQKLVGNKLDYAHKNFKFTLLEYRPASTPDETIDNRESYWKEVLLTRGKYGLNQN